MEPGIWNHCCPEKLFHLISRKAHDEKGQEPGWFSEQGKRMGMQRQTKAEKDMEIALATKKVLGQNLMQAIQNKGTVHALEFCNVEAMPLTNSMALKYNAVVEGVSDRNRNLKNLASAEESALIDLFSHQVSAVRDPQPVMMPNNGKTRFYS